MLTPAGEEKVPINAQNPRPADGAGKDAAARALDGDTAPAALVSVTPTVTVAREGASRLQRALGLSVTARGLSGVRGSGPSAGQNAVRLAFGMLRVSSLFVTPDRGREGGRASPRRTGFWKVLIMEINQDEPNPAAAGTRGDGGREFRLFLKCQLTQNCLDFVQNVLVIFNQYGSKVGSEVVNQGSARLAPMRVICSAHCRGGGWGLRVRPLSDAALYMREKILKIVTPFPRHPFRYAFRF